MTEQVFLIDVGRLDGLASLHFHLAGPLRQFTERWVLGEVPEVVWDLRQVEARRMNIATLAAFLALAHRMSLFTGRPHEVLARWDPEVFGFLADIDFFEIGRELGLFVWDERITGGYPRGRTNPYTKIVAIRHFPIDEIPEQSDIEAWKAWKDWARWEVKADLLKRCGCIFQVEYSSEFSEQFVNDVVGPCSEMVVNALLHGRSIPFVALQRSTRGVSVAVCDSGRGFLQSLREKPDAVRRNLPCVDSDPEAVLVGSVLNRRELGLRRAIGLVVGRGGWVVVSSGASDITWRSPLWRRATEVLPADGFEPGATLDLEEVLGRPLERGSDRHRIEGAYRVWREGLRGSRVCFELPVGGWSAMESWEP